MHFLKYLARFSAQIVGGSRNLAYGHEFRVALKFRPSYRGRFEDRLEIVLEDAQLRRTFIIIRQLKAIVGEREDHALLKPIAPYTPRRRSKRQVETEVIPGVVSFLELQYQPCY